MFEVTEAMLSAAMEAYCGHVSGRPDPVRLRASIEAALRVQDEARLAAIKAQVEREFGARPERV